MKWRSPKSIRVAGIDLPVVWRRPRGDRRLRGLYGYCDHSRRKIVLCRRLGKRAVPEILWHEVLHAAAEACNVRLAEEDEKRLARATFAVLRDNPGLVEMIRE